MKGCCFVCSPQLIPSSWDRKGYPQMGPYKKDDKCSNKMKTRV